MKVRREHSLQKFVIFGQVDVFRHLGKRSNTLSKRNGLFTSLLLQWHKMNLQIERYIINILIHSVIFHFKEMTLGDKSR